jgi:hypothetical protein
MIEMARIFTHASREDYLPPEKWFRGVGMKSAHPALVGKARDSVVIFRSDRPH